MQTNKNRSLTAFTLIELLVVTAILALLAALISPTLSKAKDSAKISSSIGRLRQMHLSARLYSSDLSDDARVPHHIVYTTYLGLGKSFFISPCGIKRNEIGTYYEVSYWYPAVPYQPESYFARYGENALQFVDVDCDAEGVWQSRIATKRALGVTDGGQLINKLRSGDPYRFEWWMSLTEPLN